MTEPVDALAAGGSVVGGSAPAPAPSPWNVPNALTVGRILLVPVVAAALVQDRGQSTGWRLLAFLAFAIAIATDRLDGDLARRRGLITDFGKVADPIADKTLIGTVLVLLSVIDRLPWWVTGIVLVREIGVTALRLVVIRHGIMPAGHGGKLKTILQSLAISLYVLPVELWFGGPGAVAAAVMGVAVVVTVLTGLDYVLQAYRLREGSARTAARRTPAP